MTELLALSLSKVCEGRVLFPEIITFLTYSRQMEEWIPGQTEGQTDDVHCRART